MRFYVTVTKFVVTGVIATSALCFSSPLKSADKNKPIQNSSDSANVAPPVTADQQGAVLSKTLFDVVGPSIRQALCQNDQKIYDQIAFYFPTDPNYLRVRAGVDDSGKRAVEVSSGYVNLNSRLLQALIYSHDGENSVPTAKDGGRYLEYVAQTIRYRSRPVAPEMRAATIDTYSAWAGIPHDRYAAEISRRSGLLTSYMVESFVFTMFHEIAHHVLGHPTNLQIGGRRSRDQEWAADLYAMSGLSRLGLTSFGTTPYFMLASELEIEDFGDATSPSGTHDPSSCRLLFLLDMDIGITEVENKRRMAANFCGRDLEKIRAALASQNRDVCFRP